MCLTKVHKNVDKDTHEGVNKDVDLLISSLSLKYYVHSACT